jgi:hypothetical protein
VAVCLAKVSKAEVDRVVGSTGGVSASRDRDAGIPLQVAISRCKARR